MTFKAEIIQSEARDTKAVVGAVLYLVSASFSPPFPTSPCPCYLPPFHLMGPHMKIPQASFMLYSLLNK